MKDSSVVSSAKPYFPWVVAAQGVGCLLVLMGHAIQAVNGPSHAYVFGTVNSVIYSFHMPLFFFLSGFLSARGLLRCTAASDRLSWLGKRALRLLVPYFFMGLCWIPARYLAGGYAANKWGLEELFPGILLGNNPSTTLWFLWALFVIDALACVIITERSRIAVTAACVAVAWACIDSGAFSALDGLAGADVASVAQRTMFNLPVFLVGLNVRRLVDSPGDGVIARLFNRGGSWRFLPLALIVFAAGNAAMLFGVCSCYPLSFATALAGIALTCCLSDMAFSRIGALMLVGSYCMDVYILGEPVEVVLRVILYQKLGIDYLVCMVVLVVVAAVLPIVLSKVVIRKSRLLGFLVLGRPVQGSSRRGD